MKQFMGSAMALRRQWLSCYCIITCIIFAFCLLMGPNIKSYLNTIIYNHNNSLHLQFVESAHNSDRRNFSLSWQCIQNYFGDYSICSHKHMFVFSYRHDTSIQHKKCWVCMLCLYICLFAEKPRCTHSTSSYLDNNGESKKEYTFYSFAQTILYILYGPNEKKNWTWAGDSKHCTLNVCVWLYLCCCHKRMPNVLFGLFSMV